MKRANHTPLVPLHILQTFTVPADAKQSNKLLDTFQKKWKQEHGGKKGIAFAPFRGQPWHPGHVHVIQAALLIANQLIIGIGSANISRTDENPWTANERKTMLIDLLKREQIDRNRIRIITIDDDPSDDIWLQKTLEKTGKQIDVVVSNNEWVSSIFQNAHYVTQTVPFLGGTLPNGKAYEKRIKAEEIRAFLREKGYLPSFEKNQNTGSLAITA
ncbi:MAG TPA: adenylyltransferase/cytidyltransferase family protein [Patescibacteria group bacterium]|nr:adenylyltransferase/cytidyltransferase family protein [Patescibacteria group bacterium]